MIIPVFLNVLASKRIGKQEVFLSRASRQARFRCYFTSFRSDCFQKADSVSRESEFRSPYSICKYIQSGDAMNTLCRGINNSAFKSSICINMMSAYS